MILRQAQDERGGDKLSTEDTGKVQNPLTPFDMLRVSGENTPPRHRRAALGDLLAMTVVRLLGPDEVPP